MPHGQWCRVKNTLDDLYENNITSKILIQWKKSISIQYLPKKDAHSNKQVTLSKRLK